MRSPQPAPDPHSAGSPRRPRLLLVEDDVFSAKSLRLLLTNWGYDVTVVATVADAKAALADGEAPAHMILDLMLPDGDGVELLQLIRHRRLPTKVTVTTGVADPDRLKSVRAFHPTEILSKPIDLPKLMTALR